MSNPVSIEILKVKHETLKVKHETDKVILVVVDGDERRTPKSVIDDNSEVYSAESGKLGGTMLAAEWFARSRGWV